MGIIRNMQIKKTCLRLDYGRDGDYVLRFSIFLKGNACDGNEFVFGGLLGSVNEGRIGIIVRVLEVFKVGAWEDLPGIYVRADFSSKYSDATVTRIGHILNETWVD
jgi:hypothetical protein